MGGNRARGALATLALSTVVLVAVVLAGNVSLPPFEPGMPTTRDGSADRGSFEVVDDVVIPGEGTSEPTDSGSSEEPGTTDGGDGDDVEVDVAVAPGTDDGAGYVPPTPFAPDLPDLVPGDEDSDPPLGPITPPSFPGPGEPEPPIIINPDPTPPDRPSTGNPDGDIDGKNRTKGRGHAKSPRPAKGAPKAPRVRRQPRPDNGPRWRPATPARQSHPTKAGKWSRDEPRPGKHQASQTGKRTSSVKKQPSTRHRASAVKHGRSSGRGHGYGHPRGRARGRR